MEDETVRDPMVNPVVGDALKCSHCGRCNVLKVENGRVTVEWVDRMIPLRETFLPAYWRLYWESDVAGEVLVAVEVADV